MIDLSAVRLRCLLDALEAAVIVIDVDDVVVGWNPAAERFYEIPAGAAIGRRFRDLDLSYRVEDLRASIEEVRSSQAVVRLDNARLARRSSEPVHADFRLGPITDTRGSLGGVLVSGIEATAHRRLEAEMSWVTEQRASAIEGELEATVDELEAANVERATLNTELERRTGELHRLGVHHQSILDSLEEAVVALDRRFVVTAWSRAAATMWRLPAERAVGRDFFTLPIGDVTRLARQALHRVEETGGRDRVCAVPYLLPGGGEGRATLRLAPLVDPDGARVGIVAVAVPEIAPRA